MSPEHIAQVWAAVEVQELDRLADLRAAPVLQRIDALRAFVVACALPRWGGLSGEHHAGVLAALRGLVSRAGRLVTGAAILAEVDLEAYSWARAVGLTPSILDRLADQEAGVEGEGDCDDEGQHRSGDNC